jgi:hypothetical protein
MTTYRHTQFGTVIIAICLVSSAMPLAILPSWLAGAPISWIILGVLAVVLALFYKLTVEINAEHLQIRFGIGLIRKRFFLDQINDGQPVKNSWCNGWGIRLTSHGWLYNVSGLEAVELKMKTGKTCRIGTDEPQVLATALQEVLAKQQATS